jgi:hypothetical protein
MASGVERWLAFPVQRDNMEAVPDLDVIPGYSFTPDGSAIVFRTAVRSGGCRSPAGPR